MNSHRSRRQPQRFLIETNRWAWSKVVEEIRRRDGYRSVLCGAMHLPFEVDHIVPRRLGGTDAMTNLRLLCRPCHLNREFIGIQKPTRSHPFGARPSTFTPRPRIR